MDILKYKRKTELQAVFSVLHYLDTSRNASVYEIKKYDWSLYYH